MYRIIKDIKEYGEYAMYASKSQLKAEVADSKLNWIWWVLEPFCFMLVYSFVFGVVFEGKEQYHSLFIFLGLSMWQFFSKCVKGSVRIVKRKKAIISKVYIPKFILVIQEIMVNGFKMCICLIITVVMMLYYQVGISWNVVMIIPIFLVLALFTFGVSCFMMHIGVYLEDLSNIVDIVLRMLMYFTGVFYSIAKRFHAPYGALAVKWNPMALLLDSARNVLLYHTPVDYSSLFFWGLISIVIAYAGINLVYKNENSYVKVV